MSATNTLRDKILGENLRVHRLEAPFYEQLHPEIFNRYEQYMLSKDLRLIADLLGDSTSRVLDIGAGTGNLALKFLNMGYRVDAVDVSPEMLDILRSRTGNRAQLICSDADSFLAGCAEIYDLIAFSSVLHHLPDYRATLARCFELLSSRGVLYITHEPVAREERRKIPTLQRYVSGLARRTHKLRLRLQGISVGAIDYTYSDYHVEAGISVDEIASMITSVRIVHCRQYIAEVTALAAFVNNELLKGVPILFSLIAQRTA